MSIETPEAPPRVSATATSRRKPTGSPTSSLFRVVWRWHFYAGLLVTPILVVIALTGALYLFAAEINDAAHSDHLFVATVPNATPGSADGSNAPTGQPATVDSRSLLANAEAAVGAGRATRIRAHADPQRSSIVWVSLPTDKDETKSNPKRRKRRDQETSVYVNQYTGEVQHQSQGQTSQESFFRVVLKIHRQLFAGTTGRIVVELATCWTLVLLLTGIYLWWPRRKEKMRGVWIPRWKGKPYVVLRDLHATAGIYLLPICLLLIITGLFYTLLWGESFHLVSKPWFASPAIAETETEAAGDKQAPEKAEKEPYVAPQFSLQAVLAKSRELYPHRDITIDLPSGTTDDYAVSAINDYARGTYGAMDSTGFKMNRNSGEILAVEDLSDNERYWWHTWVYPLHVGSVLGPYSKVVWLAACLILIALPVTGIWMWWKRRPAGRSGFPRKPPPGYVPVSVSLLIAGLCVLLPLFGLSILLILAAEWLAGYARQRRQALAG